MAHTAMVYYYEVKLNEKHIIRNKINTHSVERFVIEMHLLLGIYFTLGRGLPCLFLIFLILNVIIIIKLNKSCLPRQRGPRVAEQCHLSKD